MNMDNTIEFFIHLNTPPFEVQLEPFGMIWKVTKDTKITFVAKDVADDFKWNILSGDNIVQVFPETSDYPIIEVYENDKLFDTF